MIKNACALICAYNEEKVIGDVIKKTKKYLNDVYVVNDGSTDKTFEVSVKAGAFVLNHKKNMGKGQALRTGFIHLKNKGYKAIITLDADGQHSPHHIPSFVKQIDKGYDVVIGKRNFKHKSVPTSRMIGNSFYNFLLSVINRARVYDAENGYRAFKREVLPILIDHSNKGFSYESETLIRIIKLRKKLGWANISTIYIAERKSKIKPFKHILDSAKVIIKSSIPAKTINKQ